MKFTILSHAGLIVEHQGIQLLSDPWFTGSCYWRSWWNYPPVAEDLIQKLKPDFIYLTHIHWDHFQAPSLNKFSKDVKFIVPKGNNDRMKKDLNYLGFKNVQEIKHGQALKLGDDFSIVSYQQFFTNLDSALIIEGGGVTLFNMNDCKLMGSPLKQVLSNHPNIDFTFCSHSSANSRQSYEVIDDSSAPVDNIEMYAENFSCFVRATGAEYAIPFASNVCLLHEESFQYNKYGQSPQEIEEYWKRNKILSPKLEVMVSGDSWSREGGFDIRHDNWFEGRDEKLIKYQKEKMEVLEKQKDLESAVHIQLEDIQEYFSEFSQALPFFVRYIYKNHPFVLVLKSGEKICKFLINLNSGSVEVVADIDDQRHPFQIHTSAFIFKHCMDVGLFSQLGISKRARYRVTKKEMKYCQFLELLVDLYEYEVFPSKNIFKPRSLESWALRWRDIILGFCLGFEWLLTGKVNIKKHLNLTQK